MTSAPSTLPSKWFNRLVLASWLCTTGINLQSQPMPAEEIRTEMEKTLGVLAQYDYDKSRCWLTDMQELMMEAYGNPEAIPGVESLMINFLQSDATVAGKQYVCRQLGVMGTARTVPVLSDLLRTPGMAGTALLALEKIPGAEADQALLEVLEEGDEPLQIAIINSLAARQVKDAVMPLTIMMHSDSEKLALAAIAALGSIGGVKAAEKMDDFDHEAGASLKWALLDARLKCADRLMEEGEREKAAGIYGQVFEADPPPTLKYNALAGKFATSGEDPYRFISDHLRQEDPAFHPYVIRLVYQLDNSHGLGRIFDDLHGTENIPKSHLFAALAAIMDPSVHGEVIASLMDREEKQDVRMSAIRALSSIGEPSDVLLLAALAASPSGPEKELARQSLYMLPGAGTNKTIRSGIREENGGIRAELIRSTGERNMEGVAGLLFEYASDPDPNVRVESIRALGKLATPDMMTDLIKVLSQTDTRRERQEAERAIYAVTQKMPENVDKSASIIEALGDIQAAEALTSLINLIGMIGDGKDLAVLREYLDSGEEEVQLAVIRAMSGWPDAGPMQDLKQLVSTTGDQRKHTLALRGYVDVTLVDERLSDAEKLREIRHAFDISATTAESRIVISGLSRIGSLEALDMAVGLLEEPGLRKEAEAAIVRIAEATSWEYPEETSRRMRSVIEKIDDEESARRIQRILERIN